MGDFERVFGAGRDIESIIDEINRANKREHADSPNRAERVFSTFKEASDWARCNPGTRITRSGNTGSFIGTGTNTEETFMISISPGDIDVEETHRNLTVYNDIGGDSATSDSTRRYITGLAGASTTIHLDRAPPSIKVMSESLRKAGWQLYPISREICLIENLDTYTGGIDGALITEDCTTSLIATSLIAERLYKALMCIHPSTHDGLHTL